MLVLTVISRPDNAGVVSVPALRVSAAWSVHVLFILFLSSSDGVAPRYSQVHCLRRRLRSAVEPKCSLLLLDEFVL